MAEFFDDLEAESGPTNKEDVAFFTLPLNDDTKESHDKVHSWLKTEKDSLLKANQDRFEGIKKNLALNSGIQYQDQEIRTNGRDTVDNKKRVVEKVVINKLNEANRSRASKILKYKPNVMILPTNDTLADKVAAEATKNLIDHIWYEEKFDGDKLPELVNDKGPCGEAYLFIGWNPNKGDLHKTYREAKKFMEQNKLPKVPLMGDDGKPEKNDKGEIIYVDKPLKNGDVEYKTVLALDIVFDRHPSRQWRNARHCFEREVMTVEEARIKWPKRADKIKANKEFQWYNYAEMKSVPAGNLVEIWHFYHRRTDYFDKGRYIVFTSDGILDSVDFPYSHYQLPYVRWVDTMKTGQMDGVSFFQDAKGPLGAFNNINNMILRNEILVGHPKWMMPAGAADIRELGNAVTIVQYKGPVPPQLVQANPTGQGAYQLRNTLKEEGMEAADVSRTGNGNPPQGVTAAVALQYLSELEQERWNFSVLKHNEAVLETVKMSLCVAGDYYDPSDERMIRLQGNDGEWQSQFFDATNLSKDYDVRVQSASALPESKAARTETLLFLAKTFPDRVDSEQVLDMFELAQNKKFVKEGTVSIRAAEAENEMFMSGKEVGAPEEYEDHVIHWNQHVKQMREWAFKNRANDEVKQRLQDHLAAHEMMMVDLALKSPAFANKIATLVGFPMFYEAEDNVSNQDPKELPPAELGAAPGADIPYNAPVGDGQPIAQPPEELAQPMQGDPTNPTLPPVDQQLGLEQTSQEPTNQI